MKEEIEKLIKELLESQGYGVRNCSLNDEFSELDGRMFIDCNLVISIRATSNDRLKTTLLG